MLNALIGTICLISSFFSLSIQLASGDHYSFAALQGKRVLVVNVASQSRWSSQIRELNELQTLFGDSLVIIAFPSNSFGREPIAGDQLANYYQNTYNANFTLAEKAVINGPLAQPVYQWLSDTSVNGGFPLQVTNDFQKILINGAGEVVGVFSSAISPLDSTIKEAIRNN